MKQFINSTIGMQAYHASMSHPKLVKIQFYRVAEGIELHCVSGRSLERIKVVPTITIDKCRYNDRPDDEQEEFFWAIALCDFEDTY